MNLKQYGSEFSSVFLIFCVHGFVLTVPIAAGFQRGILETSTEEATSKKKKPKKMKCREIKERRTAGKTSRKTLRTLCYKLRYKSPQIYCIKTWKCPFWHMSSSEINMEHLLEFKVLFILTIFYYLISSRWLPVAACFFLHTCTPIMQQKDPSFSLPF